MKCAGGASGKLVLRMWPWGPGEMRTVEESECVFMVLVSPAGDVGEEGGAMDAGKMDVGWTDAVVGIGESALGDIFAAE